MPVVTIDMWAGRPAAQKEALIKEVTQAVIKALNTTPDKVTVILKENPKENWGIAGEVASKVKK